MIPSLSLFFSGKISTDSLKGCVLHGKDYYTILEIYRMDSPLGRIIALFGLESSVIYIQVAADGWTELRQVRRLNNHVIRKGTTLIATPEQLFQKASPRWLYLDF